MEYLIFFILLLIYFKINYSREFYIVEIRMWNDGTLTQHSRNYDGYTKAFLKQRSMWIVRKTNSFVEFGHRNGRTVKIKQHLFSSFEAAEMYFNRVSEMKDDLHDAIEVVLWHVTANSRKKAYVMPPATYLSREGKMLRRYQPHFPPRQDSVSDTDTRNYMSQTTDEVQL